MPDFTYEQKSKIAAPLRVSIPDADFIRLIKQDFVPLQAQANPSSYTELHLKSGGGFVYAVLLRQSKHFAGTG